MPKKKVTFVGKLQMPQATNDPVPKALIYDEGRERHILVPVDEELTKLMNGRPKAFFKIEAAEDMENVELLKIGDEVSDPGW